MHVELIKSFQFEAAHRTPHGGEDVLHGHSYVAEIVVAGALDEKLGWLVDYGDIGAAFQPLFRALDHRTLNDIEGLVDVTTWGVAAWIKERLAPELPPLKDVHVNVAGPCAFRPEHMPIEEHLGLPHRLRFGFEAAHALPNLPRDHKCFRMHGHSFTVEVGAEDLSALTPAIQRVYDALDHRCLNDIAGLQNPTSEHISRWIWKAVTNAGVAPEAVVVAETCTARCIYRGH